MTTDPRPPARRFDEEEIGRILERATELQQVQSKRSAPEGGLSLRELEEIAVEAGIDARHVRRAALELDSSRRSSSPFDRLTGGPVTNMLERTIAGELTDDGFDAILDVLRQTADGPGHPTLVGRTLTWKTESSSTSGRTRTLQVTVISRNGHTRIVVEEGLHNLAGALFGGITGGVGGGVGIGVGIPLGLEVMGSALAAVAFPVGVVGGVYLATRGLFGYLSRKRKRALADLLESLVPAVEEVAVAPGAIEEAGRPRRLSGESPG